MAYSFKSETRKFKSYTHKMLTINMASNGTDPQIVLVKVFNTKKPKAEVSVFVGYFSESRGVGGSSGTKIEVADPEAVALCRGLLADDTGIVPLIDKLNELNLTDYKGDKVVRNLNRWWVLAQQGSPTAFVEAERRERAFSDKKFAVGDRVIFRDRYSQHEPVEGVISAEVFDYRPYLGGGWRYTIGYITADQARFSPAEVAAVS